MRNRLPLLLIVLFVSAKLVLTLPFAGLYDFQGDELYFISAGRRLAFGYVDMGPFIALVARFAELLSDLFRIFPAISFPSTPFLLRLFPAFAGATSVALAMILVRFWKGGPVAQATAGLAMIAAPAYMRMGVLLSQPSFEPLFWTCIVLLFSASLKEKTYPRWIFLGILVALAYLNKSTVSLWVFGLFFGLLFTADRRVLLSRFPWIAGVTAGVILLPHFFWQFQNNWPTVEFVSHLKEDVFAGIPRILILLGHILYENPFAVPLWVAGLFYLLRRGDATMRASGCAFLFVAAALFLQKGKPYYLSPSFPVLFAAGAIYFEGVFHRAGPLRKGILTGLAAALFLSIALLIPLAMPILSLPQKDQLVRSITGFILADPTELTLEFHEQYGWREHTRTLKKLSKELSKKDNPVMILTGGYQLASALEFYDEGNDPPAVLSGHMHWWLWSGEKIRMLSPGAFGAVQFLAVGVKKERLDAAFSSIEEVAELDHPLAMRWHRHMKVYLCKNPRLSPEKTWELFKNYGFRG